MATQVIIPIELKIKQALDKIGTTNGTALATANAPPGMSNEDADKWHNERQLMYNLLVARAIKAFGEKRTETITGQMYVTFPKILETKPGASYGVIRGGVSVNVEVRNGRDTLDRQMLVSTLAKRGMDLPEIEKIIEESTKKAQPAKYFKCSMIQDQG